MAAVGLAPDAECVVGGFVLGEAVEVNPSTVQEIWTILTNLLLHPDLHDVPHDLSSLAGRVSRPLHVLRGKDTRGMRKIGSRFFLPCPNLLNHKRRGHFIHKPADQTIIRETRPDWLVNKQHVHLVVPREGVQLCGRRVAGYDAWSVLADCGADGGCARSTLKPEGEGRGRGVGSRFEEPEVSVDLVVVAGYGVGREVDVAGVGLYAGRGLADCGLYIRLNCQMSLMVVWRVKRR